MSNQVIFWMLIGSIIILLIAIMVFAGTISAIAKTTKRNKSESESDAATETPEKSNTGGKLKNILLLIGALSFSGSAMAADTKDSAFFEPSQSDILGLVLVNMILVLILFYFKSISDTLLEQYMPAKVGKQRSTWFKINKVLTDAVDLDKEETVMMDHEYDGIRELDNNLPPWWKWGFYATIVFAFIYIGHYHVFKTGDLQIAEYEKDMAYNDELVAEYLLEQNLNVDENSVTLLKDEAAIATGKGLFQANCVSCHGDLGQGIIGANFTDNHWIYGNDVKDVFKTIKNGAKNGMQSWNEKFNGMQMQQIASYILSIQGTFVDGGKEAQGDEYPNSWEAAEEAAE